MSITAQTATMQPPPLPDLAPDARREIDQARRGLVVVACSERKLARPAPAIELYDGPIWQDLRRHRQDKLLDEIGLFALSAGHGLIEARLRVIDLYDHTLTADFALEDMGDNLPGSLATWSAICFARRPVFLVMGAAYRAWLDRACDQLWPEGAGWPSPSVRTAQGGIGQKRRALRVWLRRAQGIEA